MFLFMAGYSNRHKDQGQTAENQSLDKAEEKLKSVERHGKNHGHQKGGDKEQDFSGHHVAKETKAKTDDADKLAQSLKEPDDQIDKAEKRVPPADLALPVNICAKPFLSFPSRTNFCM